MTSATCPQCCRLVSLPAAASPAAWVRCPLCQSEYRLHDALNFAPPALEIIPEPAHSNAGHANHVRPAAAAVLQVAPGLVAGGQSIPEMLTEPGRAYATQPKQDLLDTGTDYQLQPAEPDPMPPVARAPVVKAPVAQGAAAAILDEPWLNADAANAKQGTRRRKKPKNPVVELIKIAVGGVVGLALGYAILFWGLKIDLLDLKKHLPEFMIPDGLKSAEPTSSNDTPRRPVASARPAAESELQSNGNQQTRKGVPTSMASAATESANNTNEPATAPILPPLPSPESAQPAVPPEIVVGPLREATFTLADLSRAMDAAHDAAKTFDEATALAQDNPAEYKNLRKQFYIALAKLAETATLLRPQKEDDQIARDGAGALVQNIASNQAKMQELGTLAAAWRKSNHPDTNGIVFVGALEQVETLDKQYRSIIKPAGQDATIPVLSATKPEQTPGGSVVVLGIIVANPQTELHHYSGPIDPTVWAGIIAVAE